jgi:hypothetical protein
LIQQVKEVVAANPSLRTISFVGNSLGGLYSRFALSLLFDTEQRTVAGLSPRTFMTIASPHLGVRNFLAVPVPSQLHPLVPVILGQTGKDLFLNDQGQDEGEGEADDWPLLLAMATSRKYLDPLMAFQHRRCARACIVGRKMKLTLRPALPQSLPPSHAYAPTRGLV